MEKNIFLMSFSRWFRLTILSVLACVSFYVNPSFGAPYVGNEFTFQQPDGELVTLRLWGDEFFAYGETEDGYTVTKDPKTGVFCYAKLKPDGSDLVSTGVRVGRAKPPGLARKLRLPRAVANAKHKNRRELLGFDERGRMLSREELEEELVQRAGGEEGEVVSEPPIAKAPPAAPTINKRVSLVLLASFPDRPGDVTKTQAEVDDFCNQTGYTAGNNAASIRGYFLKQSNNRFDYSSVVTAWFTAANSRDYYTTDKGVSFGTQARWLITEGLQILKDDGFDFTLCDGDGDGDVDGINMFYAGAVVNAWADDFGLWPHSSGSTWSPLSGVPGLTSAYSKYQITAVGSGLVIGTWCHENGHMICNFPDLYPYNGNAANVGYWSLMGSGNYGDGQRHPTSIDVYLKMHAGWMDVVDLTSSSHQRCVIQVDGDKTYRFRNPSVPEEYFLVEVEDNTGYEGPYGGSSVSVNQSAGLVVWHCKQNGSSTASTIMTADNPNCNYGTPYEAFPLEANPSTTKVPWYDDPTPGINDALKSTDKSQINDSTIPSLKFWDATGRNTASGADIHSVSADGAVMTFVIGSGAPTGTATPVLSRSTMTVACNYGSSPGAETFALCNGQGGTLSYNVSDNATWLSCSVASGTASTEADLVTVTFSTGSLPAGSYVGTITVDDGGANSASIAVNLTVYPQPTMTLTTTNVEVTGFAGMSGAQSSFGIRNTGGGEMSYSVASTQTWLSLSPGSGTVIGEMDEIYVNCDATSLSPGTYYDTVTVTSTDAVNSPEIVDVTFIVQSTDVIVSYPNGGESLMGATTQTLTWASSLGENVQIDLYKGGSLDQILVASTPNDGSYDWIVPFGMYGTNYRIRITSVEQPSKDDESNGDFTIATSYSFESGLDGWVQDTGDNLDWIRQSGSTPSRASNTGPIGASDGLYYLFTESSSPNYNMTANIYKDMDLSSLNEPLLRFDYHMYGTAMGALYLEVSTNSGGTWATSWSLSGNQGDVWTTQDVDLSAYANMSSVRVRFRGVTGSSFTSDMAFDRVCIIENAADGIRFVGPFNFAESTGVASISVERLGTNGAASVNFATSNGTATAGADYVATNGVLSWNDGEGGFKTVNIAIINDSDHESAQETVILTLSSPVGTGIVGANPTTLVIQDDDNQAPTVNAGQDQIVYLTGGTWLPTDIGVDLWLDADDAASVQLNGTTVSNWVDKSGYGRDATQTLAGSQPTDTVAGLNGKRVLTFDGNSDVLNVDLDFLAGVNHSAFIVTKPVQFSNIYGAANASAGSNSLHVGFASATNYRMNFWANDYTPLLTANFVAGSANVMNYVWTAGTGKQILANGKSEGNNTNAGNIGTMAGGGRIGRTTGHAYFGGDIAEIIIKTGSVTVEERLLFEGYLAHKWGIEAYLTNGHPYKTDSPSGAQASANLDGTATDADLDPLTTLWTLVSGPATVTITNAASVDTGVSFSKEGTYVFQLSASDGRTQVVDTVTIMVTTATAGVFISESDGSTDVAEGGATDSYSLVLTGPPTNDVTINLTTNGQVSVSPASLTFTISNWNTAQTVTVTAVDDTADEGTHEGIVYHTVVSDDVDYNGISVTNVNVSIIDNDAPGVIGLEFASYSVSETGVTVTVSVTRTGGDSGAVDADILTSNGTAVAGIDYTQKSQTLSWADRTSAAKEFVVNITDNVVYTGDRNFFVKLQNVSAPATLGTSSATVTINEDEPEPIGARVVSQTPVANVEQSPGLTSVTLTFDMAMDTNSFSVAEDITSFTGAQGTNLLGTITGHSWTNGNMDLMITFSALNEGASHRMVIGPDILNTNGFPMDQDNDGLLGEYPEDTYAANIWIASGGTNTTLWSDLVNPDDTPDPGWTLGAGWEIGTPAEGISVDGGTNVIAQNLAGSYDDTTVYDSYAETPNIDGSNYTALQLDFQAWKGVGKSDTLYIDVLTSGATNRLFSLLGPNGGVNDGAWGASNLNVTAYATGQVFRVRWGLSNVISPGGAETGWQLDAIRVSGDSTAGGDPALPMVVSHSPTGTVEGVVSSLYLSFSQPMEPASFNPGADIASFTNQLGPVTATNFSWISSTLLRLDFTEQVVSGTYTLTLKPDILDSWGQALDMDKDGTSGEAVDDQYVASFVIDNANFLFAPSALTATAVSSSQVDLGWKDNSDNETGFGLERSTNSGSNFALVASPSVDATNYSDTSVSPGMTYYYRIAATNASNSSAFSSEVFAVVPKAPATITLSNTNQVYDGSSRSVTTATDPAGLTVNVTYDGSGTPPVNAGIYAVIATISDATYQGGANGTLFVSKAPATVVLGNLAQAYSGSPCSVTATTDPSGLTVDITYNGAGSAPINAGVYAVTGAVNDVNYSGTANDTLVISKIDPTVTNWPSASDISQGQSLSNSVLSGGGATVSGAFEFDSPAFVPPGGLYTAAVSFVATDSVNYNTVGGTIEVAVKMPAAVTLSNTNQTYDGLAKPVTVTSVPVGLTVDVTYDGNASAPFNAGTYAVLAVVSDSDYVGSTNGTLVVVKATPAVTNWPGASDIYVGESLADSILSGGSASVPGTFAFDSPATTPAEGTFGAGVTFTPSDSANYNTVAGSVNVTVLPLAPVAPTGLIATPAGVQVDLTWTASSGATSYNVKRAGGTGGPYATIGSPAGASYSDTTVAQGVTYYYVVSAVNTGGESANSSEVSATLPFVLPFADDFEAIPVGPLNGQNGWEALNANVQTNLAIGTNAVSIDADDGYVKHAFSGNETNVWTDIQIQPLFATEDLVPASTDCTSVAFFNTNGHPVVYDGTNRLELTGITVTNGNWIRMTVRSDYAAKTWDLYIDGVKAAQDLGFYNDAVARYEYLEVKGGSTSDGAELDEISIGAASPFGEPAILTVISGHGAPTPSGAMEYITNTVVNAWIAGSPIIDGGTKYVCTGWIREGSEPGSGNETNMSFTITNDTTITWQWQTNYWINLGTMGE